MGQGEFEKYMKDRTIEDIMEDWGEQRDEWVTQISMSDGFVNQFLHSNGRTYFCQQHPDYEVDEKIREALQGKTVEEQMEYYYVTKSYRLYSTAYGEITKERLAERAVKLSEYEGVTELLLKENILIGAVVKGHWGNGDLLLNRCVCTYYASDNEGSGTKEREDYAYLIFKNFEE